jgi:magnesium transporter
MADTSLQAAKPGDSAAGIPPALADQGLINCAAYGAGRRVDIALEEAGRTARQENHFVWIGLYEPSEDLLRQVQQQFDLHDLAVEDAHSAHQRPKLEIYGDSLFLVLHTAQLHQGRAAFGETHIFAGQGYIVTVRHGASLSYQPVRRRLERTPLLLEHGESFVLYALMDFVVDNYFPIIDEVEAEVERIEDTVFQENKLQIDVQRIYELRRDLLTLRRAMAPLCEVCTRLTRPGMPIIEPDMHHYFRDVHDHVLRIDESIDMLRELLTSVFESSVMLASTRQNEVTKMLAAWAAILAVPTAIAGIYGMNFEVMPELKWEYGYYVVCGVIVSLCGLLYWRFKRTGWL